MSTIVRHRISISGLFLILFPIMAASRTFYVDSRSGNDSNTGTAPDSPWQSLRHASEHIYGPGDSLLLACGSQFNESATLRCRGNEKASAVVTSHGNGPKPRIIAQERAMFALKLSNPNWTTLSNLDISCADTVPLPRRTGLLVETHNSGISHDIRLQNIDVHHIAGSLVKEQGGGSGILLRNSGSETPSWFDGLLIEDCSVSHCQRNAIIWDGYWHRSNWHPNRRVVVRRNLIQGVPGDGIVPIGCDGALIEYNLMRDCPHTLPSSEAAAGFWPWSCDNTVIRFNEVADHKAPWDGQAYDADYNCRNTLIEYNFSHHNHGGLVLVCNSGTSEGVGNDSPVVRFNISVADGLRPHPTRQGMFSPSIHIAGPVKNAEISRNIVIVSPKFSPEIDRSIITSDSWDGFADSTRFVSNLFFCPEPTCIRLTSSTANTFHANRIYGRFSSDTTVELPALPAEEFHALMPDSDWTRLLDTFEIAGSQATMRTVNPRRIEAVFSNL